MNKQPIPLWIDTDSGHDDAMALLLLARNPQVNIVGVSTVAGNSTLQNVTRNTRFILELAQRQDIPVHAGCQYPLARDPIVADVHGSTGLDGVALPPARDTEHTTAIDAIAEAIAEYGGRLQILTLGPLTNVATLMTQHPDLIPMINSITIMGGAIAVPGNKSRVAEFNIFCDPEAAAIVFDAPIAKTVVPLDPCNDIVLTQDDIAGLSSGPVGTMLKNILRPYVENILKYEGVRGALMYDPLAAYVLVNPGAYRVAMMDVRIETSSSGYTYGMSVAEQRDSVEKNPNADVVTSIDGKQFVSDFIAAIAGLDSGYNA